MDYTIQPSEGPLDLMNRQARMSRQERLEDIVKREKVIDGILRWIAEDRREPTQRESDSIRHNRNVIESLKLGLASDMRDAG